MRTLTITVELDDKANIDLDPSDNQHEYMAEVATDIAESIIDTCHCFGMITVHEAATQTTYAIVDGRS